MVILHKAVDGESNKHLVALLSHIYIYGKTKFVTQKNLGSEWRMLFFSTDGNRELSLHECYG